MSCLLKNALNIGNSNEEKYVEFEVERSNQNQNGAQNDQIRWSNLEKRSNLLNMENERFITT